MRYLLFVLFILPFAPLYALVAPPVDPNQFNNPLGPSSGSLLGIICNVQEELFGILLIFAVIAFLASAFFYFTAGGNTQRVGTAKKILWVAVIGTALAILSFGLPAMIVGLFNVPASELPPSCK